MDVKLNKPDSDKSNFDRSQRFSLEGMFILFVKITKISLHQNELQKTMKLIKLDFSNYICPRYRVNKTD